MTVRGMVVGLLDGSRCGCRQTDRQVGVDTRGVGTTQTRYFPSSTCVYPSPTSHIPGEEGFRRLSGRP